MAHLGTSEGGYEVYLLSDKLSTKGKVAFVICLLQWRKVEHLSHPKESHNPATERSQLGRCIRLYSPGYMNKPDSGKYPTEMCFPTMD